MQHLDAPQPLEPIGQLERAGLMLLHADGERAHASRGQIGVVGGGDKAEGPVRLDQTIQIRIIGRNRAHHRIRMPDEHLCCRMNDDIGTQREWLVKQRRGPRIVDDHGNIAP